MAKNGFANYAFMSRYTDDTPIVLLANSSNDTRQADEERRHQERQQDEERRRQERERDEQQRRAEREADETRRRQQRQQDDQQRRAEREADEARRRQEREHEGAHITNLGAMPKSDTGVNNMAKNGFATYAPMSLLANSSNDTRQADEERRHQERQQDEERRRQERERDEQQRRAEREADEARRRQQRQQDGQQRRAEREADEARRRQEREHDQQRRREERNADELRRQHEVVNRTSNVSGHLAAVQAHTADVPVSLSQKVLILLAGAFLGISVNFVRGRMAEQSNRGRGMEPLLQSPELV